MRAKRISVKRETGEANISVSLLLGGERQERQISPSLFFWEGRERAG
ncbi:MAG: hypothetical protein R6U32_03030 [Candidatus Woesearchaeota archaeon]